MIRLWDSRRGEPLRTLQGYAAPARCVTFDPSGNRIAAAFGDWESGAAGGVKVWETKTGREVLTLKGVLKYVRAVAFSPDGTQLAAACQEAPTPLDGRLLVWDASRGQDPIISRAVPEQQMIFSVTFSRDGRQVFTGGYDNSVMAWDAHTGEPLFTLKGHTAGVLSMVTTPDGTRLISASGDVHNFGRRAEVIVWNLLTNQRVLTLTDHADAVLGLALSANGRWLSTAGRDGKLKIWNAGEPAGQEPEEKRPIVAEPTAGFNGRLLPKGG
ncbi:MAG: WD40 repeat domain-containing protein [Planctomycetales bacterium]